MSDLNPQATQMADESMVRTLAAQTEAIWPQEVELLRRLKVGNGARVLDAGCGTGEFTARAAAEWPDADVLGVDVLDGHLEQARRRCAAFGGRVRFENRSVFDLGVPDGSFDLTVCRHVLQAIGQPERALAELKRVTRRGGWLHLIAEDYGMMHFPRGGGLDPNDFWHRGPPRFGEATGSDMYIGRNVYTWLRKLGFEAISIDYVVVDPLRVPRDTFARIWEAWRDGYVDALAQHTSFSREQATAHFDAMIATLRDPERYAVWQVPVVEARVP